MCQSIVQITQSEVTVSSHNNHKHRQSCIALSTPLDFLFAVLASAELELIYAENYFSLYEKPEESMLHICAI